MTSLKNLLTRKAELDKQIDSLSREQRGTAIAQVVPESGSRYLAATFAPFADDFLAPGDDLPARSASVRP